MEPSSPPPVLEGLVVEAVEWLPSGAEAGLVRVRGRWADAARREAALPALGVRRGGETRQFESLPDARFGRDPAVWRGTYLVPAGLMADPAPELWLSWESGARSGLPAPDRGFEPPAPADPAPAEAEPDTGGEVIDRAVLAERRARRAEAAEREQARRAAEALKALEVLELRSSELERRLEALRSAPPPAAPEPVQVRVEVPVTDPAREEALAAAVADVRRLRGELDHQRSLRRKAELLRAADAVALAAAQRQQARADELESALDERTAELADAMARAEQAAEQVRLARARAAADAAEVRARASAAEAALGEAREELDRLRAAHAEASAAAEERAHDLASIGAELARVRGELEAVRADAAGRVAELERRLAGLDAELAEERRARVAAAAELEAARAGAGVAEAARRAETVARAALEAELDRERSAHSAIAQSLAAARTELEAAQASRAELVIAHEDARAEVATARGAAEGAEAALTAAQAERDAALAAHRAALAELDAVRARLEEAGAGRSAADAALEAVTAERDAALADGAVLRAVLEAAQADAASVRTAYDAAAADATAVREAFAAVQEDSTAVRAALEAAQAEISAVTASRDAAQRALEDLEAERDEVAREALALHEELATLRDELAAATAGREEDAGGLIARIAELEAAADADLATRAAEQAAAAEAARADAPADDVAARFDAAAAALRESAPVTDPEPAAEAGAPAPAAPRRIVDEAGHGARGDLTGSSQREYPWLRGTIVKLAHDDPQAAARLLLQLVPAQAALLQEPLEYDLTIRELGTHAVSVGEGRATATAIERPRMRTEAEFHAAADALTLAELLAGVPKRIGRWRGPVRINGRRRRAEGLREVLAGADLSLAAAAWAGAALDPDLVFRLFAYAIQPAWTKGHAFSIAQEVDDGRWLVTVADGAPVAVAVPEEGQGADATVVMTRAAFDRLLRDEPAAAGELPVIRGDRAAVATLKAWTDRAQGR